MTVRCWTRAEQALEDIEEVAASVPGGDIITDITADALAALRWPLDQPNDTT